MKKRQTRKVPGAPLKPRVHVGQAPHAPGEAGPAQPQLRLPNERDESTDATSRQPDPAMEQAAQDLKSGQVDTDLRNTPGLDAQHREKLLRKSR